MGTELNEQYVSGIVNTSGDILLPGYAVTATGDVAASGVGFAGINKFEALDGEPLTVVHGRVAVVFNGTPGSGVELSVHTDGTLDAAVTTDITVGTHLEDASESNYGLGIAWIWPAPGYVVPAP